MQRDDQQFQSEIGRRVAVAREMARMTQEQLSKRLGFNDRQTLSAIESGQRKLAADELMTLIEVTGQNLDFFTDGCRLVGEGTFSFRSVNTEPVRLDEFEQRAGQWIAAYRRLGYVLGQASSPLGYRLTLTDRSTYEEARAKAENLVKQWELGDVPADRLVAAAERNLAVLVLYVDVEGISGAACRLADLDTILINRRECVGRRNFDLAHELFHLLTWDRMPPVREDGDTPRGHIAKRVEELANNFASALLIPAEPLRRLWDKRRTTNIHDWLNKTANVFHVTALALKWRLVHLDWLSKADLLEVNDSRLVANGEPGKSTRVPHLFSHRFAERMHAALEQGHITARRAAGVMGTDLDGLVSLLGQHGFKAPFDL